MFGTKEVKVVPYNPAWVEAFKVFKDHVEDMIGDLILSVEHVGSTSVPGLWAKPVIDFDVVIEDYRVFPQVKERLEAKGYKHLGDYGIQDREVFYMENAPFDIDYHFYVCPSYGKGYREHIALREYLLENDEARDAYSQLKVSLAKKYPYDVDAYCEEKTAFISAILNKTIYEVAVMPPTMDDEMGLGQLFEAVVPHSFAKEGLPEDHEDVGAEIIFKKQQLKDYLTGKDNSTYLICKKDHRIVGSIWHGPVGELIIEGSQGALAHLGEVGTVFVHPAYQGMGIGRRLVLEMEKALKAKGISSYALDSGYPTAQRVWCHKFGQPTFVMKDQWGPGMDHYIWQVNIK